MTSTNSPTPSVAEGAAVPPADIRALRATMTQALGAPAIAALHAPSRGADLAAAIVPWLAIAAGVWVVGLPEVGWPMRLTIAAVLAWLFTINGLVAHDQCVHRRTWGDRISWWQAAVSFAVLTTSGTGYALAHTRHHARIGTADDTEAHKQDLDTVWRRLAYCTVFGVKLARSGRWARPRRNGYLDLVPADPTQARRIRIEKWLVRGLLVAMAALALVDPVRVLWGYVVPIVLFAPVLNSVRIVIEHADLDPAIPFSIATCYRTGLFTRVLFLADSGDCHLVHHVYPRIPYYRVPAALRLMLPVFERHGVPQRRSFAALLAGWFVHGYPHRTPWPLSGTARR
jgi:fatty acid desaturase